MKAILFILVMLLISCNAWAQEEKEHIVIFGTTPLQASEFSADNFPGRIQNATSEDLEQGGSLDITEYMNRYFSGISINSAQGNTLQPDVYYRGFSASPLLGLPIGLAIYQNGVRVNEPLGDTVNWELIPMDAVAGLDVIGGTNALYGLNSLGGSIVLHMKNGFTHPGTRAQLNGGSYDRIVSTFESGGNNETFGYYINAQRFYERGWRDLSKSWTETLYASLDWETETSKLGLNFHRGLSSLTGNGPLPVELLAMDRETYFTAPDITDNDLVMWILKGDHWLNDDMHLSANLFRRDNDTNSFNGDAAEEEECQDLQGDEVDCTDPSALPPQQDCQDPITANNIECNAINNISTRVQKSQGGVFQLEFPLAALGVNHAITIGSGYSEGETHFTSAIQQTLFTPDRVTLRTGPFDPDEAQDLRTRVTTAYAYLNDSLSVGDDWTFSLSAYYHDSEVELRDQSGNHAELNGNHDFQNFNWSIGTIHRWNQALDIYGSYNESSRLPTPIELACSEEVLDMITTGDQECRLPNAFLADPPLDEVIAKSFEVGLRGFFQNDWRWSIGAFHTRNKNDIIFQTTGRSRGLFKNIDETKRVGVESALAGNFQHLEWALNYTYINATFEDDFAALSPNHENADANGEIQVESGDSIPGIPKHLFKTSLDYAFSDRLSLGLDIVTNSDQYLRGDEANQMDKISGYTTFTLRGAYHISDAIEISARVENLFDKDYQNFGLIGEEPNEIVGLEHLNDDPRFHGVGAPIGAWIKLRIKL